MSMFVALFILGLLAMTDFPPNLEDGEQWLPSDIYEDIFSSSEFKSKYEVRATEKLPMKIDSFVHGGKKEVHAKHGKTQGTGVFIPRIMSTLPTDDPRKEVIPGMSPLPTYDPKKGVIPQMSAQPTYDPRKGVIPQMSAQPTYDPRKGVIPQMSALPTYDPRKGVIPQMARPKYSVKTGICKGTGVYIPAVVTKASTAKPTKTTSGKQKEKVIAEVDVLATKSLAKKELFQHSPEIWVSKY